MPNPKNVWIIFDLQLGQLLSSWTTSWKSSSLIAEALRPVTGIIRFSPTKMYLQDMQKSLLRYHLNHPKDYHQICFGTCITFYMVVFLKLNRRYKSRALSNTSCTCILFEKKSQNCSNLDALVQNHLMNYTTKILGEAKLSGGPCTVVGFQETSNN